MLGIQQSEEVRQSLLGYLRSTFQFRDPRAEQAFDALLDTPSTGLFRGPFVRLSNSYASCTPAEHATLGMVARPAFLPYRHQHKAFARLLGASARSTLVTTGTGSGKTESFVLPLLDHCARQRGKGIKAIVLYPMNALATDQAGRMAELVHGQEELRGLRVGLFIGENFQKRQERSRVMRADKVVEDRQSLLEDPPDILLTNFKMLDLSLLRQDLHDIWRHNLAAGEANPLRYVVLDEMHTYDGAQGTDVAHLLRRLKAKMGFGPGRLVAVGTSATLGGQDAAGRAELLRFAERLFGERFDADSVVVAEEDPLPDDAPGQPGLDARAYAAGLRPERLLMGAGQSHAAYTLGLYPQEALGPEGQADPMRLGQLLLGTPEFLALAQLGQRGFQEIPALKADFAKRLAALWGRAAEAEAGPLFDAFWQLAALARKPGLDLAGQPNSRPLPLFYQHTQLWVRELTGLARQLDGEQAFVWREDRENTVPALPPFYCRACGQTGWLGLLSEGKSRLSHDASQTYNAYFAKSEEFRFVLEYTDKDWQNCQDRGAQTQKVGLDLETMILDEAHDAKGKKLLLTRKVSRQEKGKGLALHCPYCDEQNEALVIVGTKLPTLFSVGVSQLLASGLREETDSRKVLAFSNSVQDAAFLAGFAQARNYRFSFRTALQRVIRQQEGPWRMDQLARSMAERWKAWSLEEARLKWKQQEADQEEDTDEKRPRSPEEAGRALYFSRFMPDAHNETRDGEWLKSGKEDRELAKAFDLALDWAVLSEFGYNARVGRTLEKTGTAGCFFDPAMLAQAARAAEALFGERFHLLEFSPIRWASFVDGLLHRMRSRGAISHPFLAAFRHGDHARWLLSNQNHKGHPTRPEYSFARGYGRQSRTPMLVSTNSASEAIDTTTHKQSWFHAYLVRCAGIDPRQQAAIKDFYQALFEALAEIGLLDKVEGPKGNSFALRPEAIGLSQQVSAYRCRCGQRMEVAQQDEQLDGAHCLAYDCVHHFEKQDIEPSQQYYRQVYRRDRVPKVQAHEHTGLLERGKREKIEEDFKKQPKPDSLNLLLATSTLEMGIDIGSLDVVLNTQVPPMPSNFLQRVGRAGRSSGNALVLNYCDKNPHDLYYLSYPREMMEGKVHTPGCHLEALPILTRHALAFLFDEWVKASPHNMVPKKMGTVFRDKDFAHAKDFFLNRIHRHQTENSREIQGKWRQAYQGQLPPELLDELLEKLPGLPEKATATLLRRREQLEELKQSIVELRKRLRAMPENDPHWKDLKDQERQETASARAVLDEDVLEFLTHRGLLPNYAFPEEGVELHSTIRKELSNRNSSQRSAKGKASPNEVVLKLARPASSALRELAPGASFYAQGFHSPVSRLSLNDLSEKNGARAWRLCAQCDHLGDPDELGACPQCGDTAYGSPAHLKRFVRPQLVLAHGKARELRISDSREDRLSERYVVQRHFAFTESLLDAWVIPALGFGWRLHPRATVTEMNLGLPANPNTPTLQINERKVSSHGFITCTSCGTSSPLLDGGGDDSKGKVWRHSLHCPSKEKDYPANGEFFQEHFLYHQFDTECLELSFSSVAFEEMELKAAAMAVMRLGLKNFFGGKPEHIRMDSRKDPLAKDKAPELRLVLYDTVPGGTGYLSKLADPEAFFAMLEACHERLADCSCQHEGKKGCYGCVYAYQQSGETQKLEREKVFAMVDEILKHKNSATQARDLTSALELENGIESKLEQDFIRLLFQWAKAKAHEGWKIAPCDPPDPNHKYDFQFAQGPWLLRFKIGLQHKVSDPSTIADAIFRFDWAKNQTTGQTFDPDPLSDSLSWLVYVDGYAHHGKSATSGQTANFARDVEKRLALWKKAAMGDASGYRSWTLTHDDIQTAFRWLERDPDTQPDDWSLEPRPVNLRNSSEKNKAMLSQQVDKLLGGHAFRGRHGLERFLEALARPVAASYGQWPAKAFQLFPSDWGKTVRPEALRPEELRAGKLAMAPPRDKQQLEDNYFVLENDKVGPGMADWFQAHFLVRLKGPELRVDFSLRQPDAPEVPKPVWQAFWQHFNLAQLLGGKPLDEAPQAPRSSSQEIRRRLHEEYEQGLFSEKEVALLLLLQNLLDEHLPGQTIDLDHTVELNFEDGKKLGGALLLPQARLALGLTNKSDEKLALSRGFRVMLLEDCGLDTLRACFLETLKNP